MSAAFLAVGSFYVCSKRKNFKKGPADTAVAVFLSGLILSALSSVNISNSLRAAYQYMPLILLYYVVRLSDEAKKSRLVKLLVSGAVLVSIWSMDSLFTVSGYILENKAKFNITSPFVVEYLSRGRAFAPFITPNLLASYLAMMLFIAGGVSFERAKSKKKDFTFFACLACVIICPAALFFTKSVGGWGVLLLSFLLLAMLRKKFTKKIIISALLLLALFACIFVLRQKTQSASNKPVFSIQKRLSYWKDTAKIIRARPVTGIGPGNFAIKDTLSAHNSYLQLWAETGILGLAGWLGMIFIFVKNTLRKIRPAENNIYFAGLLGAGIVFILHNTFDFSFFVPQVSFLWWIILALTDEKSAPLKV